MLYKLLESVFTWFWYSITTAGANIYCIENGRSNRILPEWSGGDSRNIRRVQLCFFVIEQVWEVLGQTLTISLNCYRYDPKCTRSAVVSLFDLDNGNWIQLYNPWKFFDMSCEICEIVPRTSDTTHVTVFFTLRLHDENSSFCDFHFLEDCLDYLTENIYWGSFFGIIPSIVNEFKWTSKA